MNVKRTEHGPIDLTIDGNEYAEMRERIAELEAALHEVHELVGADEGEDTVDAVREWVIEFHRYTREVDELTEALRLAAVRLDICLGRMLGRMAACHEQTRMHELLDEVAMFRDEARAALGRRGDGTDS